MLKGLAVLLALLPTLSAAGQSRVVSARAGLVTGVEGEVLYHCHQKGEGVGRLRPGEQLHDGDRVFTGQGGRATWDLNPGSYMTASADSNVRVYDNSLGAMHFDVERGEVVVIVRSLKNGAALTVHAPPGPITVRKAGRYLFRVEEDGETEAAVGAGELRYREKGKEVSLGKGRKVTFRRTGKGVEHEQ